MIEMNVADLYHHMYVTEHKMPIIEKVIYNNPATIVYWKDETKTVVKCQDGDIFDKEKGLLLCIAKKAFGNDNTFNKVLNKFVGNDELVFSAKLYETLHPYIRSWVMRCDGLTEEEMKNLGYETHDIWMIKK